MDSRTPAAVDAGRTRPFVVVTGASEGIGFAIAERLAAQGRSLLLIARRSEPLLQAAGRLRASGAACVETLVLDITSDGAAQQIGAAIAAAGGHLDLLVNCAGMGLAGPFDQREPAEIDELIMLNVVALTRLMRHFLPELRSRRTGGILNVASLGGYIPGPNQAAYYASKSYVISLSEAIAAEVGADGVMITVVSPGPVTTGFHAKMGAEGALYRWLVPSMSPRKVAVWALAAHAIGLRSVVPGFINIFMMFFLRILPHRLVVPVVAWLLKPRMRLGARNAGC